MTEIRSSPYAAKAVIAKSNSNLERQNRLQTDHKSKHNPNLSTFKAGLQLFPSFTFDNLLEI